MKSEFDIQHTDDDAGRAVIYLARIFKNRGTVKLYRLAANALNVTVVTPEGRHISFSVGEDHPGSPDIRKMWMFPGWISVDQAPPPKDGEYLVCTRKGAVTTAHFYPAYRLPNGVYKPAEWQGNRDVAYWMPMPEPPVPVQPPAGAVRIAKLGRKRIWVDENNDFVAEVK